MCIRDRAKGLHLPIVCNTGGYATVESVDAWRGYIDIWLADLKYVSSALSAEMCIRDSSRSTSPSSVSSTRMR